MSAEELAARASEMPGLAFIRAVLDGKLPPPPFQRLLDYSLVEAEAGRLVLSCLPRPEHYNPIGVVHGGLAATLLDSAMGGAVHTTLGAGEGHTTLESKVNLVRPITAETGEIRAEGTIVHRGGRVATAESRLVRAADERLLAHGTSTCLLLPAG